MEHDPVFAHMRGLGWKYDPYLWMWLQRDMGGVVVAREGDATWERDFALAQKKWADNHV